MGSPHRSGGVYSILARPRVYERLQKLLGGDAARRRIVDEFLKPLAGAKVLDVGCGTGQMLDYLPADADYTGLDFNAAYIADARQKFGSRGRFVCARLGPDVLDLGFGTFDHVLAIALLHHLDDGDVGVLVAAAARLLRPGGIFLSVDGAVHPGQSPLARLMLAVDRGRCIRTPEAYRSLIEPSFASVESVVLTDLLPIPYSHFICRAAR